MVRRVFTWFQTSFSYLWLVALAVYFSVLAGQSMYRNYQAQQQSSTLKQQLVQAQQEKERLQALLVYYQTESYQEKALRENLLLKMPNETVYALPESAVGTQIEDAEIARRQTIDPRTALPPWRQWMEYLFGAPNQG